MEVILNCKGMPMKIRLICVVLSLAGLAIPSAWAQPQSIKADCGGVLTAPMAQTAALYQQAVAALKGSEAGWCAVAAASSSETHHDAALWEFVSAAYVLHALRRQKQLVPAQRVAMRAVLARIPGIGNPPTRLKAIDTALYVHMRTLSASDSSGTMVALDAIEQHSPAVYRTLVRRSIRWGDADDN